MPLPHAEAVRVRVTSAGTQSVQEQRITPPRYSVIDHQFNRVTAVSSVDVIAPSNSVEERFRRLAHQWRKDTRRLSSLSKMVLHPDYQKIVGMGYSVVPFILRELRESGGHWLWALHAITDEDPAAVGSTFREAKAAWLDWGTAQGYLS